MRTASYKGNILGNSVSAFNFYKKNTGRGLQADVAILSRANAVSSKLEHPETLTDADLDLLGKVDIPGVVVNMYVALRQAGDEEARKKNPLQIQDELEFADLQDPELLRIITELMGAGSKKE